MTMNANEVAFKKAENTLQFGRLLLSSLRGASASSVRNALLATIAEMHAWRRCLGMWLESLRAVTWEVGTKKQQNPVLHRFHRFSLGSTFRRDLECFHNMYLHVYIYISITISIISLYYYYHRYYHYYYCYLWLLLYFYHSFLFVQIKCPPPDRPFGLWGRRMKKGCWFVCGQTKQIRSWNLSKNWSDEPIICKERERYHADCQRECFTFVRWMWSATAQSCPCLLWLLCMFGRWCSAKLIHCSI